MGVRFGTPPGEAERLAQDGVEQVARSARLKTAGGAALTTTATEQVSLSSPHEMRHVRLDALTEGRPLDDSETTGWRYLVVAGGAAVAGAEVATDAAGGVAAFSQLNEGPFVQSTAEALRALEERPEAAAGNYEVRMVRVPALYVMALWLEDLDGDQDLVLPLAPAPAFLDTQRMYPEQEFLDALAGPARERLAFDDTPQE
jgi:hypothetical protein